MFTVLVSAISNSHAFLLKKCKATHIVQQKNITVYAICNDPSFNDTLTNGIISFEQMGPGSYVMYHLQNGRKSTK